MCAHILTTGGSDEDGQPLASGSHDLIAPQGRETAIYSAVPGGYGFVGNDASLAAPHVSGAAALVWSVDERLTGDAVRRILISTAQANSLLDVNAAVAFALENKGKDVPAVTDPEPEPEDEWYLQSYQSVTYPGEGWSETYDENGNVLHHLSMEGNEYYTYDEHGRVLTLQEGEDGEIHTFLYKPTENGSSATVEYSPSGWSNIPETREYDANYRLILVSRIYGTYSTNEIYTYYPSGKIETATRETVSSSYTFTYDEDTGLIISSRYDEGDITEITYRRIDRVEIGFTVKKNGTVTAEEKTTRTFDDGFETVQTGEHEYPSGTTSRYTTRSDGKVTKIITTQPDGKIITTTISYDDYGHMTYSKRDYGTHYVESTLKWAKRTKKPAAPQPGTTTEQPPTTSSPQTQVKVVTAYEKSGVDQTGFGYSWSIPKIEGGSGAFDRINQEIWKTYYDGVVNEGLSALEKGTSVTSPEISYQWAINGDILSLLVIHHYLDPSSDYLLYNVSVSTGKDVSRSDILKYKGLSDDAYTLKVRQAIGTVLREGNPDVESWKDADMIKSFNTCLTNSLSDKNVSEETRPYLNDKGQLCIAAKVYSVGGAPYYLDYINTETIRVAEDYDKPVTVSAASADGNTVELTFTTERQDYTISGGNNVTVSTYYDLVVASGSDAAAVKRVNDFFRADFQDYLDGLEREGYFREYLEPDCPYQDVTLQNTTEFVSVWHKHDVISVEMGSSWFMGGVFNGGTYGLNIDVKTGREPDLAALFMNGDSNALLTRLKQALTTFLTENGSAREAGSVGSFTLEDFHYLIRDDELILWLGPYELMPGGWTKEIPTGLYVNP